MITIVTGSYPPDVCGVGDYTAHLFDAGKSYSWNLIYISNWKFTRLFRNLKQICSNKNPNIIFQYPTQGYGWSIVPQVITLLLRMFTRKHVYVALHEFSQRTCKAKLATMLFATAHGRIFTSQYELNSWEHYAFLPKKNNYIIPIMSNIPKCGNVINWNIKSIDVAYFGLLAPNKGIERFIAVAKRIPEARFLLMGSVPANAESYFSCIIKDIPKNVIIKIGLSDEKVADNLSKTKVAFLPFPDGASERRGSLLASLSNGCIVLTTKGEHTTPDLEKAVTIYEGLANPIGPIIKLLGISEQEYEVMRESADAYILKNVPATWEVIAKRYESIILSNHV